MSEPDRIFPDRSAGRDEQSEPGRGWRGRLRDAVRDRRIRFAIVAGVVVLLFVIAIVIYRSRSSEEGGAAPEVSVRTAKAERSSIAAEVSAVGTIAPQREATISAKIAAPIAAMDLLKNRTVKEGDVIATLEARDVAAQRSEAAGALHEAELAITATAGSAIPLMNAQDQKALLDARANAENARQTYERRKALFDQGGISKKDLEASRLALTTAEDDLRLAERSNEVHRGTTNPVDSATAESKRRQAADRLAALDAQLGYTRIRAPFSGVVTEQFQYRGEFANPGAKLVTIADTSSMIVKIQVADETAAQLRPGDAATVLPDDLPGQQFTGKVNLVGRGADAQSRSAEVWINLANADGRLRPNSTARVVLAARQQGDAIVVPAAAVILDASNGNAGTVMVVDAKSVAHEVHVTVGIRTRERMQILSGLRGGETVVVEGNYGLPDGTKVVTPEQGKK
ncbi:MAG TPA: efflux RND transporter periplasmic adaptor subunit [Thermoanaerobaculia bacterium]|nr:efflux RND transporter periplasmic adaptor subunit [Thermoanaerobaculia bacterium]